jgi:hypothetical protein
MKAVRYDNLALNDPETAPYVEVILMSQDSPDLSTSSL